MRSVRGYFLPIILAVYSDITRKVDGFRAESLDGMPRNQWTTCSGMTGRLGSEYALSVTRTLEIDIIMMLTINHC
ncbi:MAG: hypothetical protein A2Y81_05490 [Nitrospirae bacterium RBG_13_43_8]|nr:MAG: hypothetical protein A2Y81_05490 [Nitrospirae bacterium RBG_13_43_8]